MEPITMTRKVETTDQCIFKKQGEIGFVKGIAVILEGGLKDPGGRLA
jgi:hypothetical protein